MDVRRGRGLRAVLAGSLVFGTVVVALAIGGEVPASATPTTVVNCNTGGNLQTAINAAVSGSALIVHGTCTGNFFIGENLTLQGPGTLSGTGYYQSVLAVGQYATVLLNNLTIENGSSDEGGGITNDGTLTVKNSTVSGNSASLGGGIFNLGMLTVTNSTLSGNNVPDDGGGGIANYGTMNITNSTLSGNTVLGSLGGGIYNDGTGTVTNCTVSGNTAGFGGGIWNYSSSTLTLTNSTLSGNNAGVGGGIYNDASSTLTVANSTLFGQHRRLRRRRDLQRGYGHPALHRQRRCQHHWQHLPKRQRWWHRQRGRRGHPPECNRQQGQRCERRRCLQRWRQHAQRQ